MELVDCYRMLGLRSSATFADVKASYRRLAQQYHPDINPNDQKAKEKFIALTEAYKFLLQVIPATVGSGHTPNSTVTTVTKPPSHPKYSPPPKPHHQSVKSTHTQQTNHDRHSQTVNTATRTQPKSHRQPVAEQTPPKPTQPPNAREVEMRLKWNTYQQLQGFLRDRRFPQAIALAEALAERLPDDVEVRQWQAISYQLWGRALINEKQWLKARIYLKKALKTDPNNKTLCQLVQQDFQRLEQVF